MPPACAVVLILWLHMTCIRAMSAVLMNLLHLGNMRGSTPLLAPPHPTPITPPHRNSQPIWMMAEPSNVKSHLYSAIAIMFLWAQKANEVWMSSSAGKWNIIPTCLNDVYKSSPAVPRRVGITSPPTPPNMYVRLKMNNLTVCLCGCSLAFLWCVFFPCCWCFWLITNRIPSGKLQCQ